MTESYRQSSSEEQIRELTFESLAQPTQQRLRESFEDRGALVLLKDSASLLGTPRRWGTAGLFGWLPILAGIFASSGVPLRVSLSGLAVSGAGLAFSSFAAFMGWRSHQAGVLRPGVFLFARELVDARKLPTLRVIPTSYLESVIPSGWRFVMQFREGERFSFSRNEAATRGYDAIQELPAQIATLRERAERADSTEDMAQQRALDPFVEERARWQGESSPKPGVKRAVRGGIGRAILASMALGAALAWPAAKLTAVLHDRAAIYQAAQDNDLDTLLRHTHDDRLAETRWVVEGKQNQKAVDALYSLLPSNADIELRFLLLNIEDPRRTELDDMLFQRVKLSADRALLQRYARQATRHADEVSRKVIPQLDLDNATSSTNLRGLWRLAEDTSIDEPIQAKARATIDKLYAKERATLREKTRLATPLSRMGDEFLSVLSKSSLAAEALAEGHATGDFSAEFDQHRASINTEARRAMVHAFYTHIDPDVFRVRAQSDAEDRADEQSPRLQLLYKMHTTTEDPEGPVSIELTIAFMHSQLETPHRVELRYVVPSPLKSDDFYEKLRDKIAEDLKGGLPHAITPGRMPGRKIKRRFFPRRAGFGWPPDQGYARAEHLDPRCAIARRGWWQRAPHGGPRGSKIWRAWPLA